MKRVVSMAVMLLALGVTALGVAASAGSTYKVSAKLTPGADVPKPVGASGAKGSFSGTYVENKKGAKLTWKTLRTPASPGLRTPPTSTSASRVSKAP